MDSKLESGCINNSISVNFQQGSKGERGPIGVPGAQGLTGTKADKVREQGKRHTSLCVNCVLKHM